jgi:hypothetical protein
VLAVATGTAENSAMAEECSVAARAVACPAAAGLRGTAACRGRAAAWHDGAAMVSECGIGEVTGLHRSVKKEVQATR